MSKRSSFLLWPLWVLLLMQGCITTPIHKTHVTITLEKGKPPVTLYFRSLLHDFAQPFRELLEKLEKGEKVDINQPIPYYTPLEEAIHYALGGFWYRPDRGGHKDFHAARYLLSKRADPNTAIHELCSKLRFHGAVGKRGLVLLLSYGARLDIQEKELPYRGTRDYWLPSYTPLRSLEGNTPWVPQSLREEYEKQAGSLDEEPLSEPPTAWETAMPPDEQQERKTKYFTDIAEQLIKPENNRGNRLHPSFVKYLEEKTQVGKTNKKLIERLRAITAA